MALDSYANLQTAVASFLNRTDLTATIPDFITLCEARIRRTIRTRHTSVQQATLAAGDTSVTLPSDLAEVRSVSISGETRSARLDPMSYSQLVEYRAQYPSASIPKKYAIVDDELELAPTLDASYTVDIEVEGPFLALSVSNTSNWILADYPDVYLYGTLAESAPFLKDDERIGVWNGRFEKAMAELDAARERWQFAGPIVQPMPRTFAW